MYYTYLKINDLTVLRCNHMEEFVQKNSAPFKTILSFKRSTMNEVYILRLKKLSNRKFQKTIFFKV